MKDRTPRSTTKAEWQAMYRNARLFKRELRDRLEAKFCGEKINDKIRTTVQGAIVAQIVDYLERRFPSPTLGFSLKLRNAYDE